MNLKQLVIAFALYKLFFEKKPRPLTDQLVQPYPDGTRGQVFIEGGPSNPSEWQGWPGA